MRNILAWWCSSVKRIFAGVELYTAFLSYSPVNVHQVLFGQWRLGPHLTLLHLSICEHLYIHI